MPTLAVRFLLFLSSYFPLAVIFFVLYFKSNAIAAYVSLALGCIGLVVLFVYIHVTQRLSAVPVKIVTVDRRDAESMSYIVTYIIPFLAVPSDGRDKNIALLIFFGVLAVVYVNSQMIHINPMLNALGFHLYEIGTEGAGVAYLISRKRRIRRGVTLSVITLTDDIYIEKNK